MKISNRIRKLLGGGTGDDYWIAKGEQGEWIRHHGAARSELFTPKSVEGGPSDKMKILPTRRTVGTMEDGQKFELLDFWCRESCAHRVLGSAWTGTTTFYTKPQMFINSIEKH